MKIYLDKRLLIESKSFGDAELSNRREKNIDGSSRDWDIYTWNSEGKLKAFPDKIPEFGSKTISVKLEDIDFYHNESFDGCFLPVPDHKIYISGYKSFMHTSKETMIDLVDKLEDKGISCLLGNRGALLIEEAVYTSRELRKMMKNPLKVEL